jgi:hypothetical protein
MDYVATVCTVDRRGERLVSRQYRLPADAEPHAIVEQMLLDVRHALAERPSLRLCIVQDGAPEIWTQLTTGLKSEPAVKTWDEVLDWYHLKERLGQCCELGASDRSARPDLHARWCEDLLRRDDGADRVVGSLKRLARAHPPAQRAVLRTHIRYLERHRTRLHYAQLRRRGVPIGSGVTEGACKSLIGMRAKRSGQRWSQRGLTAALHLRSIVQSERFDTFWPLFAKRYRATSMQPIGHRA